MMSMMFFGFFIDNWSWFGSANINDSFSSIVVFKTLTNVPSIATVTECNGISSSGTYEIVNVPSFSGKFFSCFLND